MGGAVVMRTDMPLTRQTAASVVSPSSSPMERHNPASADLDAGGVSARAIREYPRRRAMAPGPTQLDSTLLTTSRAGSRGIVRLDASDLQWVRRVSRVSRVTRRRRHEQRRACDGACSP